MKNKFVKYSCIYFVTYALIALVPAITVLPVDWFFESITGIKYVDGWTEGFMTYTALTIIMPILYLIALVVYWFRKMNNSKEHNNQNISNNS